jgi:L-2-hydroxyglutarate oxidase LhgO
MTDSRYSVAIVGEGIIGLAVALEITPFRGKYYDLIPHRSGLVRNLIYPVPAIPLSVPSPAATAWLVIGKVIVDNARPDGTDR